MSKIQNIDVRFNATSNFNKVKADLTALRAQAASLGAVFESNAYAKPPAVVDPVAWQKSTRAVHEASNVYRNAVSSSGMLTSQQIRATSEAEKYTKALQKQKLTLGDMRKHQGIMKQVYQDQLRYQRMTAQYWGTDSAGRAITDITIPRNVPRELDTVAQKLYFTGQMAKSAGTQIVNMGKNMQWAGRQLMVGFTYPVALFGAAAGVMAYKVDEAMTQVTKVYDVSAEAQRNEALKTEELNQVRVRSMEMAKQAAEDYGQSIESTLEVEQRLAATGLSGEKLYSSTDAVSRIATLGDLELGASTDMTIALQTAFKDTIKTADDLNDTFNYMNAVENATSLSIADIAEATPRAASAMAALGVDAREMTVLLTSMREAGVRATEAANALKSATGSVLKPSPEADEFIKQITNGRVQVTKLAEESGGNLYTAVGLLSEQMEGLSDLQKQQIIVKMFGKYQFNRVSAMIENVGAAMNGTQNQTRKAMELMTADSAQLADSAESELAQKMEAVSGRFKEAWQSMRIELAKIGVPFLQIATIAADAGTVILEFFNGMSDWKKKAAMGVAAVLAIAGPVIMLSGLFMNMAGQFINGMGRILSVTGKLRGARALASAEEQAATMTAEEQNRVLSEQQTKTSSLTQEIKILTAAYEQATAAARAYAESQGMTNRATTTAVTNAQGKAVALGPQLPAVSSVAYQYPRGATPEARLQAKEAATRAAQLREMERLQRPYEEQNRLRLEGLRQQEALNKKTAAEAKLRAGTARAINGATVGTTAMAASMALMMGTSNEVANNVGQLLMLGTFVVPAAKVLVVALGSAAKNAWTMAAGNIAAARAARLHAIQTGAAVTKWGATKAGVSGVLAGIAGLTTPVGWLVAGTAAIAGGWYLIRNHTKKAREEQERMLAETDESQAKVLELTEAWANATGRAYENYKLYNQQGSIALTRQEKQNFADSVRQYKTPNDEGGFKEEVDTYKDLSVQEKEYARIAKMSEFLDAMGMSASEAKTEMKAFLVATGEGMGQADQLANDLYNAVDQGVGRWKVLYNEASNVLFSNSMANSPDKLAVVGEQAGNFFAQGLAKSTTEEANAAMDSMTNKVMDKWQAAYDTALAQHVSDRKTSAELAGIDFTGEMRDDAINGFKSLVGDLDTFRQNALGKSREDLEKEYGTLFDSNEGRDAFLDMAANAEGIERSMFGAAGYILGMDESVDTMRDFANEAAVLAKTLSSVEQGNQVTTWLADLENINSQLADVDLVDPEKIAQLEDSKRKLIANLNVFRTFGDVKFASPEDREMFRDILRDAGFIKDKVDEVADAVDKVPDRKTISIKVNQVGDIVKTAMGNIQSRMADSAMSQFNDNWDSRIEGAQNTWDSRMDKMTNSHEKAQDSMDQRQEAAQDAFDNRWERRKEAIEREFDKRIELVNRQIAAEERADEIRQRLFEKEKARLQALADQANTNIDFNTNLDQGNLDEAAKILNNAGVKSANDQMDAEIEAAERRTQARIETLEKKNERLEKARDKELENLEKLEERMRKHLERVQDARRNALEKQQADEVKALEKSEEAAMASLDKQREYEEATLQQRLDLFLAYTARNKRDLEKWMKDLGFEYDDFGDNVMEKGKEWSASMRDSMLKEIRNAGTKVMNDNLWEKVGKSMGDKMLKGLGFSGMAEFRAFVKTGNMGGGKKASKGLGGAMAGAGVGSLVGMETRHEGGMIGSGSGSRGNIPNTYKGLHRSEKMVRAQKGEYMVNRDAAREHLPILEAINKGADVAPPGEGGAGFGGPAALMAGAIAKMFQAGTSKAFANAFATGTAKSKTKSGSFKGEAGMYGGRQFSPEQMKNAAIIASVGSGMGMSARDIQIGIMTAIAESGLVNVNYGDRDSLGLFQQRPSMGWGTPKQVTNPRYAARAFFGPLKAHGERTDETPWLAAQHIQRSAFADGSNYREWWAAAQAIFKSGLSKRSGPGGGYVAGSGGKRRPINAPVTNGLHGGSTAGNPPAVDLAAPRGTPVYAVANGRITSSRDIAGPLSSDIYRGDGPYGSFGRMITMQTDSGAGIMYAHLSRRSVGAGQRVKGGAVLGYSGNTGNSSGPHLHFGATNGPYAWLRKGGTVKHDDTPAVLHRGETVLTDSLTRQFKDNVASRGGDGYNVTIDMRGSTIKEDVDIEKAVNSAIDKRESRVGRKRVVK